MNEHPYDRLTPDLVIDAVESTDRLSDARLLALNSYENRVYQVGLEDGEPLVVKFYRPGRWSRQAILEEHALLAELREAEIPVCAPIRFPDGGTLHQVEEIWYAVWPRTGRPQRWQCCVPTRAYRTRR